MARHFARHRPFYRAMLTGSCSWSLNQALIELISPINQPAGMRPYAERGCRVLIQSVRGAYRSVDHRPAPTMTKP